MNRIMKLFGVIFSLFFTIPVMAGDDDIMITRDGEMKPVKIERISKSQVVFIDLKHKKDGSQTHPTDFVYMIMKEKGNNIFFDEEGSQMTSPVVKYDKDDNVMFMNKGEIRIIYNMSISKDEITYQLKDKKSEPFVNTPKKDVFMVLNSDGTTTLYNESYFEKQNEVSEVATPALVNSESEGMSASATTPVRSNVKAGRYKIGDIYNANGLKGLVVYVDNSGVHGLIMSLQADGSRWSKGGDLKTETECMDVNDGQKNFEAIERYINETGGSWDDFPLFKWAKSLGEGWYIPANAELELIAKAINGGSMTYNESKVDDLSKKMKDAGGDGMINKGYGHSKMFKKMFSSTEIEGGSIYTLELAQSKGSAIKSAIFNKGLFKMSKQKGELKLKPTVKNIGNAGVKMIGSRAIHKF